MLKRSDIKPSLDILNNKIEIYYKETCSEDGVHDVFKGAPMAEFFYEEDDCSARRGALLDLNITYDYWDANDKRDLAVMCLKKLAEEACFKTGYVDQMDNHGSINIYFLVTSGKKIEIEDKLQAIFRKKYEEELVDGKHPTLLDVPNFSYMESDDLGSDEIQISIECRKNEGDDEWAGWVRYICLEHGLTLIFNEYQDNVYHMAFEIK